MNHLVSAGDARSGFPLDFPENDDGFDWQDPDAGSLDGSVLLDDPHHPQPHFHHHHAQVEPQRLAASAVNRLLTPFAIRPWH